MRVMSVLLPTRAVSSTLFLLFHCVEYVQCWREPQSDRGRTAVGPQSYRGRTAVGPRSDRSRTAPAAPAGDSLWSPPVLSSEFLAPCHMEGYFHAVIHRPAGGVAVQYCTSVPLARIWPESDKIWPKSAQNTQSQHVEIWGCQF